MDIALKNNLPDGLSRHFLSAYGGASSNVKEDEDGKTIQKNYENNLKGFRETKIWYLGLASFYLAIKFEENRDKFDYYDFADLIDKEGPPPGIKGYYKGLGWIEEVLEYESKLLQLLDWKVGNTYHNTSLGHLEWFLRKNQIDIKESQELTRRLNISVLVLQLVSLLLPEWMIEGVIEQGSNQSSNNLVNCLRAHAAWLISCQFYYSNHSSEDNDNRRSKLEPLVPIVNDDCDRLWNPGSIQYNKMTMRDNGSYKLYYRSGVIDCDTRDLSTEYLKNNLIDETLDEETFMNEALEKSKAIQEHMKALIEYIVEFYNRMEDKGSLEYYRENKKKVATKKVMISSDNNKIHSLLIPLVSANESILQELSACFSDAHTEQQSVLEKVTSRSWINSTFRSSLGYSIRCSYCLEYGHNRRSCYGVLRMDNTKNSTNNNK